MALLKISDQDFQEKIAQNEFVVLKFFATWCGPCKMVAPIIEELSNEYQNVKFYEINIDDDDVKEVIKHYQVEVVPTIFFIKNQEIINTTSGFKPKSEFVKILDLFK